MPSPDRHVIVDGSNIATEGRSLPSLQQLDEAVQAFQSDNPDASVTVVVDATFAHRIAKKERKAFDAAVDAGEIIVPPAGAVGRGDAFILQVAAKGDAEVLSNDSFQEFHGEHKWLFDEGRLVGAKPVDGIGWVFVDRVPVRGPESRRATKASSRSSKKSTKRTTRSRSSSDSGSTSKAASERGSRSTAKSSAKSSESKPKASSRSRSRSRKKSSGGNESDPKADNAKKDDSEKSDERGKSSKSSTSTRSSDKAKELNSPSEFLGFVTKHSIGDVVRGTVERFSSHGCYLQVADAQCYLPVKAMGDPPPSKARDVVSTGDNVEVRVESLDAERRGINVELIQVIDSASPSAKRRGRGKQTQPSQQSTAVADGSAREANPTRRETNVASKSTKKPARKTAKKASAKKAGSAKKAAASRSAKKTAARKSAKKSPAKKATAKKTAAKKSTRKAPAKKTAAKKSAAKKSTKKAPAKKTPAKKTAAKKSTKKAPAKKSPAKATASKRAQKATAKKASKRSSRR